MYDAVFPDALALFDNLSDYPQGDAELEMDCGIDPNPDYNRYDCLFSRGKCGAPYGACLMKRAGRSQAARSFNGVMLSVDRAAPHNPRTHRHR